MPGDYWLAGAGRQNADRADPIGAVPGIIAPVSQPTRLAPDGWTSLRTAGRNIHSAEYGRKQPGDAQSERGERVTRNEPAAHKRGRAHVFGERGGLAFSLR